MKYRLKVYSIWEFGQRKDSQGNPHQEDNMYPEYGKQSDSDRLFILCDGMGGHDAGEIASATVCEAMSRSILNDGHDSDGVFTDADFKTAIDAAFKALDEKDNGAEKKMGTTMTFLKLFNGGAFIAHMGDSRVYHIRPGKTCDDTEILFETSDHSLVNDLIKIGELTREEAVHSRQKNVITRAMQPNMGRQPKADVYTTTDIQAGDYFYMCSDGMLEQPDMENGTSLKNIFSEMGSSDENKVEILKSVTEKNRDNHTAFIIHITEVIDPIETESMQEPECAGIPDKFLAIVEEDPDTPRPEHDNIPVAAGKAKGQTEAITANTQLKETNRRKKHLITLILRFLCAAVLAAAAIVGFRLFKSCSGNEQGHDAPKMENIDKRHKKTDNEKPARNSEKKEKIQTNESDNIEAAPTGNSTQNTNSSNNNSQPAVTSIPPKFQDNSGVVNSDLQNINEQLDD